MRPQRQLFTKQNHINVLHILSELSERERMILILRFVNRRTYPEIAEVFKITAERVKQLEEKAYNTINHYFK